MKQLTKEAAIAQTIKLEGGFVIDHAGPTNRGITIGGAHALGDTDGDGHAEMDVDFDGDIDAADITSLTLEDTQHFYSELWDKNSFSKFNGCAPQLFDLSVNMGYFQMAKVFQRALTITWKPIAVDGKIGPVTMRCLAEARKAGLELALFSMLQNEARSTYSKIAKALVARGVIEQATAERYLYVWNHRLDSWT